jgi:hypothetical protein
VTLHFFLFIFRNQGRQLVAPGNDQNLPLRGFEDSDLLDNRIQDIEVDVDRDEESLLDSFFGGGAQSRIVERMNDWVVDRASENPGCVERFVCESYRTGESLSGIPYLIMTVTKYVKHYYLFP